MTSDSLTDFAVNAERDYVCIFWGQQCPTALISMVNYRCCDCEPVQSGRAGQGTGRRHYKDITQNTQIRLFHDQAIRDSF